MNGSCNSGQRQFHSPLHASEIHGSKSYPFPTRVESGRIRGRIAARVLIGGVLALSGAVVEAGLVEPFDNSWASESKNGRYVYVQIATKTLEEELRRVDELGLPFDESNALKERIHDLRKRYTTSGLYAVGGENGDPLWAVTHPLPGNYVHVAPDGSQILVPGEWIGNPMRAHILTIITNGVVTTSIDYADLFGPLWVRWFLAGTTPECEYSDFNGSKSAFIIRTDMGDEIIIDTKSGQILASNSAWIHMTSFFGNKAAIVGFVLLVLLGGTTVWFARLGLRLEIRPS